MINIVDANDDSRAGLLWVRLCVRGVSVVWTFVHATTLVLVGLLGSDRELALTLLSPLHPDLLHKVGEAWASNVESVDRIVSEDEVCDFFVLGRL